MFDFSFGEVGLIAVVALLVLGPERLPKVARTAGALMRRARSSWHNVREEIERELQAEDLKRSLAEARQAAADLGNDLRNTTGDIHAQIKTSVDVSSMENSIAPPPSGESPPPPATPAPDERH